MWCFCFWSWTSGNRPHTGGYMAIHWLRYILKIFQYWLPLYSFNYLLWAMYKKKKRKKNHTHNCVWQQDCKLDEFLTQPNCYQYHNIWSIAILELVFTSVAYEQYTRSTCKDLNPKDAYCLLKFYCKQWNLEPCLK